MAVNWREELIARRRREPFEPFRVTMKNGDTYDVLDRYEFLVGDGALALPVHDSHDRDRDYAACLHVSEVALVEPIEPRTANGRSQERNGPR